MREFTIAVCLLCCALPAAAQTVAGTVRSAGDGQPVPGVLVVLANAEDSRMGGAITNSDGDFLISVAAPGRYRLVAERIGYASVRSAWFSLGAGESLRIDLEPSVEATRLEGVVASGERRCVVRPEEGMMAQRLWDEARKALTAADVTRELSLVRWRALDYSRDIEPESGRVLSERSSVRIGNGDRPYTTAPIDDLTHEGFVRMRGDTITYYAPDAGVLVSDPFLDTHCFRAIGSADGEIGLAFEPVPDREVTDIRGILWMDQASFELRRLEFSYTWLPLHVARQRFGGLVEFERLPTGAWITRRWELKLPKPEVSRDLTWRCTDELSVCWRHDQTIRTSLGAVREEGGEVMGVNAAGGTPLVSSPLASVRGLVFDSIRGVPLVGAEVYVSGTSRRARTDEHGRYEMSDLRGGEYALGFLHPVLDSMGVIAKPRTVRLVRGETASVDLAIPSRVGLAGAGCEGVVLSGTVTDALTANPLPGARVVLYAAGRRRATITAAGGVYHFCDVPSGLLELTAEIAGRESATSRLSGVSGARLYHNLRVPLSTAVAVAGRIVDFETDAPIGTAVVSLLGTGLTQITNAEGRFMFPVVPPGAYQVEARHLAYGRHADSLRVGGASALEIEIRLPSRAIPLEGVVATVTARHPLGPIAGRGFDDRRALGFGHFIGPEELAARPERTLPGVLRTVPGVRVEGGSRGQFSVWMARQAPSLGDLQVPAATCAVRIYVDRVLWRGGIDEINLADIVGIEVYRGASEIPGEFGGSNARCGVIVLWTRRGA